MKAGIYWRTIISFTIFDRWTYSFVSYKMNNFFFIFHYVWYYYFSNLSKGRWQIVLQIEEKWSINDCFMYNISVVRTFISSALVKVDFLFLTLYHRHDSMTMTIELVDMTELVPCLLYVPVKETGYCRISPL